MNKFRTDSSNGKVPTSGSGQQERAYGEPSGNEESVTQISSGKRSRWREAGLYRGMKNGTQIHATKVLNTK